MGKNGNEGGRPFSCAGLERKDDIVCTDGVRAMNVGGGRNRYAMGANWDVGLADEGADVKT